jgi:hypothetical protein
MPKPIKKLRVDIMAVLKNHELRIMMIERSLYQLVQALSTAAKEKTESPDIEAVVQSEPEHVGLETSVEAPGQPLGED